MVTLNIVFTPKKSTDELALLAGVWSDVLPDVSDADLKAAVGIVIKESQYFPTPNQVIEALNRVWAEKARDRPQIEEKIDRYEPTSEEWQALMDSIGNKIPGVNNTDHQNE